MKNPIAKTKKIILGITGSFGSGKSTVAKCFKSRNSEIIDADKLAHALIKPGSKIYRRLVKGFGKSILKKDRSINRYKLGRMVFGNKKMLRELNRIIHPEIIHILKKRIKGSAKRIIVLDVPLLVESGLEKMVDKIIVVKISEEKQMQRLIKKGRLSKEDIQKRINAQAPLSKKLRIADFIIDNNGSIKQIQKQVEQLKRRLGWKS